MICEVDLIFEDMKFKLVGKSSDCTDWSSVWSVKTGLNALESKIQHQSLHCRKLARNEWSKKRVGINYHDSEMESIFSAVVPGDILPIAAKADLTSDWMVAFTWRKVQRIANWAWRLLL
jgi:hypothetical protein